LTCCGSWYRSLPAAHDLYLALPSDSGLTPAHSHPGVTTPQWSQPLLKDGCDVVPTLFVHSCCLMVVSCICVCFSRVGRKAGLVASYGKNKAVVKWPKLLSQTYGNDLKHMTFYGRLISEKFVVNVDVGFQYSNADGGYVVEFDLRDPETYTLEVALGWFYGDGQPGIDRTPILVGGHQGHGYRPASHFRALIDGSPIQIVAREPTPEQLKALPRFTSSKCTTGDAPGRWVNMFSYPCSDSYCTGDRSKTVGAMDWDGSSKTLVWVPYDCYFHLYSRDDMYHCAASTGVDWIHAMGDSQQREFVAHLKMMNGTVEETTKFEQTDFVMHGSPNNLRVTWQFYTRSFLWTNASIHPRDFRVDQRYFDHFNIRPSETSGQPLGWIEGTDEGLPSTETSRPSVFVMNHASAYAAWYLTWEVHERWVDALVEYLDGGRVLAHPSKGRPMRLVWLSPSFIFSQAHPGTDFVSTHRLVTYNEYVVKRLKGLDAEIPVVDGTSITKSMWESAYDGLHYLRGSNDNWYGSVSSMVFHAVLNAIYPDCVG
jgi:hypothetical protein